MAGAGVGGERVMLDSLRAALAQDERIAYALMFGSTARGAASARSDVDVAIGLRAGIKLEALELGALMTRLEAAAGKPVDLTLLDEAPPGLAYRVIRDGIVLSVRDARALAERRARAILEYLDFQPFEELFTRGALSAAARGR
jgi:predicted nucleotidyltransferase